MSPVMERSYAVEGMTCGGCERSLSAAVGRLAGVEVAEADSATGRLLVRGVFDDSDVRAAVDAAGYRFVDALPGQA